MGYIYFISGDIDVEVIYRIFDYIENYFSEFVVLIRGIDFVDSMVLFGIFGNFKCIFFLSEYWCEFIYIIDGYNNWFRVFQFYWVGDCQIKFVLVLFWVGEIWQVFIIDVYVCGNLFSDGVNFEYNSVFDLVGENIVRFIIFIISMCLEYFCFGWFFIDIGVIKWYRKYRRIFIDVSYIYDNGSKSREFDLCIVVF